MNEPPFFSRMQRVFGCSLSAMVLASPMIGDQPKAPTIFLNGCCGPLVEEHKEIRLKLKTKPAQPLTYQEALAYCNQLMTSRSAPEGTTAIDPISISSGISGIQQQAEVSQDKEGDTYILCSYDYTLGCVAGRLPAGIQEQVDAQPTNTVGAYFAQLAYLEKAAVTAFEYLLEELKAYQAPTSFLDRCVECIREEEEHTELAEGLARRYGASPPPVEVEPFQLRPFGEIARENIVEGCVRETYGTLMAMWQSCTAHDFVVRWVMERIATEESGHSELSWQIAEWARSQLSEMEWNRCLAEQNEAVCALRENLVHEPHPELVEWAGFPTASQAQHLFASLEAEMWAPYQCIPRTMT